MEAIRFCPFCGSDKLTYYDDQFPVYGFCPKCKEWVSGAHGFNDREVMYIVSKLEMIARISKEVKK